MTVSSTTNKVSYTAAGSQTVFAYTFKIYVDADLKVYVNGFLKTLTTDYTVSDAGVSSGGNVTFGTGLTASDVVVVERVLTLTQGTDYVENDPFPAETHEAALDRLTFISQQHQDALDRSIKFATTVTDTGNVEIREDAAARANRILAFDSTGQPEAGPTLASITSAVTDAAAYSASAAVSATESATSKTGADAAKAGAESAEADTGVLKSDTQTIKNDTQALKTDVTQIQTAVNAALAAASIPGVLTNKAGEFLQVKQDESAYELVSSVAAPQFFGLKMSADGLSIESTYGEENNNAEDYDAWMIGEGVTFAINNNELQAVL